ncbi:cobaltochelatase CobT-related protein [Steroidobacter agaridevorans]|uniref:cobaltochelatase CobT-related protein n=1 Tax=Steroidobacter agaridevorans TaxID=2695856 RepID=UPI001321AACF|nr:cobaltochelatase subunit CobT [Steroidobacter agaridevorans]GFE85287.1 cobaltochelatase subunit CobT [Steroidobacter agaridevorans]
MIASAAALDSRTDVGEEERLGRLKQASLTTLKAISDAADPPGAAALIGAIRQLPSDSSTLAIWRGRVDAHAFRLRFSDPALHAELRPAGAAAPLYDALEQCRVEALGMRLFPGARANLAALYRAQQSDSTQHALIEAARNCFEQGSEAQPHRAQQSESTQQALIEAATSCFDQRLPPHSHDERSVSLALSRLAKLLHDQRAFGIEAARFAEEMARGERSEAEAAAQPEPSGRSDANEEAQRPQFPESAVVQAEALHVDILRRISNEPRGRIVPRATGSEAGEAGYRVFTREFDAVVDASSLIDDAKRRELTHRFEDLSAASRGNISRWAHRLQRYLLSRQRRSWTFDCEEGLLDAGRLARVVCDPLLPLLFKQETDTDWPETAVTILIDNSGSMRGLPIVIASVCAEQLGAVLERCGVTTEILGFTTQRWRGGRSRERWIAERRPPNPGRLTDLNHIIYKSADVQWRHARRKLIAMLDESLLKENVDGEALLWAHQRLRRRPERRKILMVISDGAPLDDATLSANDFGYLDRHLRSVIESLETDGSIELLAIGIGHDVGSYYANAFTVTEPQELGEAMVRQLVARLKAGL